MNKQYVNSFMQMIDDGFYIQRYHFVKCMHMKIDE